MKITFLGGGNMANALIGGLLKQGAKPGNITVLELDPASRQRLIDNYGVTCLATAEADTWCANIIVLAVKPQQMQAALPALTPHLANQIVVSIAAGLRLDTLSRWLGGYRHVVRAMPNTPAMIGAGVTGLCAFPEVAASERQAAENILHAVGSTLWVEDEAQMDALTAISGSGPAYVFLFIEALQHAAEQLGFQPEAARQLALQTFSGAASLAAQTGEDLALLRQRVTSKGGTTEAALQAMLTGGIKETILAGALAANARSIELGKSLDQEARQ
jgi:pyrroline-5-carboxylate reductase